MVVENIIRHHPVKPAQAGFATVAPASAAGLLTRVVDRYTLRIGRSNILSD